MKICTLLLLLSVGLHCDGQRAVKIHRAATVVDTHNDILEVCIGKGYSFDQDLRGKTQTDLARLQTGGVDVQFFSIWCDGKQPAPYQFARRMIDTLYATIARNPEYISLASNSTGIRQAVKHKKIAAMIGVEGGHMIENDIMKLDSFYNRGARYLTLTWNNSTEWATSAMEETTDSLLHQPKGLSEKGKEIIRRMNELGMLVDLSHAGERTFWDAIQTTTKPVIASHSCAYRLCPVFRNLRDDQIKAIGANGGVIQLNFFAGFLDSNFQRKLDQFTLRHQAEKDSILLVNPDKARASDLINSRYATERNGLRPPMSLLLDHLDYIVQMIGVEHVGLGSDFDGVSLLPLQLDDVTSYPLITQALMQRGYTKKVIRKILGGNLLRVFRANERK